MIDLYISQTQAKKYDNESIYNVYATSYRSGNEKTHNHMALKNGYRRNMKEIKLVSKDISMHNDAKLKDTQERQIRNVSKPNKYNIDIKKEKTSAATKDKLRELQSYGFITDNRICFKCLKYDHGPYDCPDYKGRIADKPCTYVNKGVRKICGYHSKQECKFIQNTAIKQIRNDNQGRPSNINKQHKVEIWQSTDLSKRRNNK